MMMVPDSTQSRSCLIAMEGVVPTLLVYWSISPGIYMSVLLQRQMQLRHFSVLSIQRSHSGYVAIQARSHRHHWKTNSILWVLTWPWPGRTSNRRMVTMYTPLMLKKKETRHRNSFGRVSEPLLSFLRRWISESNVVFSLYFQEES